MFLFCPRKHKPPFSVHALRTEKATFVILFPAIDLKNGQCVRLKLGDMAQATVFNDDPAAQAKTFEDQGFRYLHIVDLDGAFSGKPENAAAVDAILKAITIPAQLGGGIRDLATIEGWLAKGIKRLILGTVAVRNPALVREACAKFPGRVAVGIDAKGGKVAVEGWAETSELTALDLAKPLRGRRRVGDHLHRYRSRWRADGAQPAGDRRVGACRADSRHRLGWPGVAAGYPRSLEARECRPRRRHHRAARSTTAVSIRRQRWI